MSLIITLDGTAGSYKSTVARLVAERISGVALDSGSFYRIIAHEMRAWDIDPYDNSTITNHLADLVDGIEATNGVATKIAGVSVSYEQLKRKEIDAIVSAISWHTQVRDMVNASLRAHAASLSCPAVCEGRDIGHVVFPDANCKFYFTASVEVRAQRCKHSVDDIIARDLSDMTKPVGYLLPVNQARSDGYIVVDTTDLTSDQAADIVLGSVNFTCLW